MLDYSLLKVMVKQALSELQPFKVEVQPPKKGTVKQFEIERNKWIYPPMGKQWEILYANIYHFAGVGNSILAISPNYDHCETITGPRLDTFWLWDTATTLDGDYNIWQLVSYHKAIVFDWQQIQFEGGLDTSVDIVVLETDA